MGDMTGGAPVRRGLPRWALIALAVLVVVAVTVLVVLFARSITARLASARLIDRATTIAKSADVDVVAVDAAVRAPLNEQSGETKVLAVKRIEPARAKLQQVVDLTDRAYEALNDDEREQAVLLRDTAVTRLAMLKLAEPILATDGQAVVAAKALSTGWDHLVAAKGLSRDAAAQYNKLTKSSVALSNRLLVQARSQLASATSDFETARQAFSALDMAPYLTYVASLKQLNALAQQSNTAWLKGKTADANVITTRYNILEKQALEQAGKVPSSPNKAITDAYNEATSGSLQAYIEARKKATEADAKLREH